jgi:RNA polymerase sigma factor (sigma-70 family)
VDIDEQRLLESCFRLYAARVHTFVLRRADPEAAQEVTAETFLIAWRRRAQMPPEPLPWLYGIARRVLANEQRARSRRVALTARIAADPAPAVTAVAPDAEILGALAELGDSDREALLLCAWEGLSAKEAAQVVGCSAATFAVRLHRARRRLARVMHELAAETDRGHCNDSIPEVST